MPTNSPLKILSFVLAAFFSCSVDAFGFDPKWKLSVKVKGKSGEKVYYPDANGISILGTDNSRCTLSKQATATGSASRVIECKRGSVRRSSTLGFDRKMQSTKTYEVYFSTKKDGEPDITFQLSCCQKTS